MKNKQQWYDTLKAWVPQWFFEAEDYNSALFYAMARVLEQVGLDIQDTLDQTYLDRASGSYLDLHGDERVVPRLPGENDPPYAVRIKSKSLVSQISKPALIRLINQLLIRGVAAIKEDWEGGVFFSRNSFFNRGEIVLQPIENTFTIVVDKQIHEPYSFFNREHFLDREDYIGTAESSDLVFQLILNAVNDNKALGVFYRIIERLN